MASIAFQQVTKSFDKNIVIPKLDLTIQDGSFTVLVGPSGCGKTTLLRMVAGIEHPTSGTVRIGGRDVTRVAPGNRGVAMVFQNYALYPTMTVRENIEFGLINNKVAKRERTELTESISETVGLLPYLDRKPSTLSGGQRQRVALARAMVKKPEVFLMDEPLSNLDAKLRGQMRLELIELHKKLGTTFVYVTHDQVEAMSMADTIVLMNQGMIQQEAAPEIMYRQPANLFTAQFIGVPPMNVNELGIDGVRYGFRPENAILSTSPLSAHFAVKGVIVTREMLGSETLYQVRDRDQVFMIKSSSDKFSVEQEVVVGVEERHLYFFDRTGTRLSPLHPQTSQYAASLRGLQYV